MDENWQERVCLRELVEELATDAAKKYRIDTDEAVEIILDEFDSNPGLEKAVVASATSQKLKRTSIFKKAASAAKKRIYYQLRNYHNDSDELSRLIDDLDCATRDTPAEIQISWFDTIVQGHASTRERLPSASSFYDQLFKSVSAPQRVLDVGCGVHPIMFPFVADWADSIEQYVAAEKNPRDVACLQHFSRLQQINQLKAFRWEISDGWNALESESGCAQYDVAFVMKVVPVVRRQQRELLATLAQTPARTWVLSGSRVALAKRRSIEKREQRVLQEFVELSGRTVKHEFAVEEEFVWIVEPK